MIYQIVEQVNRFNYWGNNIGYYRNSDIDVKLGKFQTICGIINCVFRNKVCRDTNLSCTKLWPVSYTHLDVYKRQVM